MTLSRRASSRIRVLHGSEYSLRTNGLAKMIENELLVRMLIDELDRLGNCRS